MNQLKANNFFNLTQVFEEEADTLTELQREIDEQLERDKTKRVKQSKYISFLFTFIRKVFN